MSVEHNELVFENRLIKHLENIGGVAQASIWYGCQRSLLYLAYDRLREDDQFL